jgi:hypothetical protein
VAGHEERGPIQQGFATQQHIAARMSHLAWNLGDGPERLS